MLAAFFCVMNLPPIHNREQAAEMVCELQGRALACAVALRRPPPQPDTCCGRGCNGCVWEGYYAAVECWREDALLLLGDLPPQG